MKVKISDYIANLVAELGIKQVYTVTGGGAMHLNDAFGHCDKLSCMYNHHEQACAIAAESYARIKGEPALLCVTTGPGGTNAITGVLGAYLDSIPMLVISGQVRYDTTARSTGLGIRAMGDQEFDITKAVCSLTKYAEMIIDPKQIKYAVKKAYHIATTGRPGPCWLDIPLDVQGAYIDTEEFEDYTSDSPEYKAYVSTLAPKPEKSLISEVADKVLAANRPVINAGNGIRIAGAFEIFEKVKSLLDIPVVTGWNSIDICADEDPLYVGRAGIMGDRPGNFAVQNSDLLLSVGSRLSIRQVGYNYKTWARAAYTIVEDVDGEELKKPTLHVDIPVWADAKDFLEALYEELLSRKNKGLLRNAESLKLLEEWKNSCEAWKKKYPVVLPRHYAPAKEANVYAFIKELSSRLKENQITVVGNGSACVVGSHGYVIKKGQRFIINSAVASMGYDLPAAVGAWVAAGKNSSESDIICVTGDGSIQMNLQELQTIIHHQMNMKIFVINNGGYHSIRQTQKNFFGEPLVGIGSDSGDLSFPSMEKLATAYGFPYVAIYSNEELVLIDEALSIKGPAICEVFVSKEQLFEPKSATKRLSDGTLVSAPLEDLAPFLPEEELKDIMIIPMVEK